MLKAALAGCGLMANKKYIPALKYFKADARIAGICDINKEALDKTALAFGIPDRYEDFSEMLVSQKPDLVVISTPPETHRDLAVKALAGGSDVLLEKPMALNTAECDEMIETAKRHERKLGVMHSIFFNPPFESVLRAVSAGRFGRFLGMRVFLAVNVDYITSRPGHWAHNLPAGMVSEIAPHAVYLSLPFLKKVNEVNVTAMKQFPDYPWSLAEEVKIDLLSDDSLSSVVLSFGSNQSASELDIICSRCLLRLDLQSRIVVRYNRPDLSGLSIAKSVMSGMCQTAGSLFANALSYACAKNLDGHYSGVKRFFEYIKGNKDYPGKGEEAREVVRVMEMISGKMKKR